LLKVYGRFEAAFTSNGIAVLENASDIKIKEVINGEYTLSFVLPRNDPKWQYIKAENFVKAYHASQKKDQIFRIRSFDEIRDEQGKVTSNIQCEHAYYDAADSKHIPIVELIGQTPTQVLQYAFSGTRFTIGTVEITTPTDIFLSKANPAQIVTKLIENVGGELIKDNWTINLVTKRGSDTGGQFRFGKNIKSLKRNTDGTGIVTRLYPYGKDGMQIDSVNSGVAYLNSPLINDYDRPHVGYTDYKDIEDPQELKDAGLAEWSTSEKDGIDKPRVTYNVEIVELCKLKEFGDEEAFAIGDTNRIIDPGIDADTQQRIIEYVEYPYEPKRSSVGLGNYETKLYSKYTTAGMLVGFMESERAVDRVITSEGRLNPGWFENIKTKLSTLFNGGLKKAVMHQYGDIWVDDPDNPTKAMGILADGFAIANSKKANGDWDWKTFGTADGFVADLIVAGILKAVRIEGCTIIGSTFKTSEIGKRLELLGNKLVVYNADNEINGVYIDADNLTSQLDLYEAGVRVATLFHDGFGKITLAALGNRTLELSGYNIEFDGNVSRLEESGYATKQWVIDNFAPKI
jgi:phage minor structural protein